MIMELWKQEKERKMADEGAIIRNPMSLVLLAPVNKETPETINL